MSEKKQAIRFFDENDKNWNQGIHFLGDSPDEIVITKNDKQYIRGSKLCVEFNGIVIYADLDQRIVINRKTNTVYTERIKQLAPPEEREYVLLIQYYDDYESRTYESVVGRQAVFDRIKTMADDINLRSSLVLVETVPIKDSLTVYEFMKKCIEENIVENNDGFDIEEYYLEADE